MPLPFLISKKLEWINSFFQPLSTAMSWAITTSVVSNYFTSLMYSQTWSV
jgi:hypothetical protein